MRERQEYEVINNPEFGLLHSSATRCGSRGLGPTPDDLDESDCEGVEGAGVLSRASAGDRRVRPRMHAAGRAAAHDHIYGSPMLTWRGVPLVPTDKIVIGADGPVCSTILLMRVGEDRRGVVGLHQP